MRARIPTRVLAAFKEPLRGSIELEDAVKAYPGFSLGPVTFSLGSGDVVALVGVNGSGKTTLLNLLSRHDGPTSGVVNYSIPPAPLARQCGYVTDGDDLPEDMTAAELFDLVATLASMDGPRRTTVRDVAHDLCDYFEFRQSAQLIKTLSHGNRQKVKLISAIQLLPAVLLLDEPRNGLDPVAIVRLETLIDVLAETGRTTLIATHDLHHAARSSSRILALDRGTLVFDGETASVPGGAACFPDWFLSRVSEEYPAVGAW